MKTLILILAMCLIVAAETWMTFQAKGLANRAVEAAVKADDQAGFWQKIAQQEHNRWTEQYSICKSMLTKEQRNSLDGVQ